MKKECLKCGRYAEVEENGYCTKCSKKALQQGKRTTVEQRKLKKKIKVAIILIILIFITLIYVFCKDTVVSICKMLVEDSLNLSEMSLDTSLPSIGSNIKNETVTAENCGEINERIMNELSEDEAYYMLYAETYYIYTDGIKSAISSALSDAYDETEMYVNIYGKTVKELIDEGKQLMENNEITLEEYKENLQEASEAE